MSDITRKLAIFTCFLFTSFCFWKTGVGLTGGADTEILPSAQAAMSPSLSLPRVVTTPIQQMRPGMRVVGRNPLRIETEATIDPTPAGWRLVSVRMRKEDGSYFEAELLRPLSWIYRHRAQPRAVIMLNMPELHVVGAAEVLSISACPPIDPGDGPVVISTFRNTSNNVLNLYVEGETEPIGVTAGHPIWSEDRQAFIHSDQLQPGERLRSALGKTVRITSIEIRAGPEPVYNLEVAGEHVYSVTDSGLLVHNTTPCQKVAQNVDPSNISPFHHRIDPNIPGRPDPNWSIDTKSFSTWLSTSQKGYPRNSKEFWLQWEQMRPETLSPVNRALIHGLDPQTGQRLTRVIKNGKNSGKTVYVDHISPKVDSTWLKEFPEHGDFKWQTLEHHHTDEGRYAIPLPWELHRGEGNYNTWHGVYEK